MAWPDGGHPLGLALSHDKAAKPNARRPENAFLPQAGSIPASERLAAEKNSRSKVMWLAATLEELKEFNAMSR
jgi:hypothetical protein